MHIAIIALGSRGDVQPYIALALGLQKAGHTVRLVTQENYEPLVVSYGLDFWCMRGNVQDVLEGVEMRELLEKGNLLAITNLMAKETRRAAVQWAEDGLVACQGMDLLITSLGGIFICVALAEKLDIPLVQTHLAPFTPTKTFPSALIPQSLPNLGGAFNLLSQQITQQITWLGFQPAFSLARQKVLGLPPATFSRPFHSDHSKGLPTMYGFSPSVIHKPLDWDADNHVTGYWFLDSADNWTPQSNLMDFLEAGPPPVYIGFGSMSSRKPEETAELVVKALEKTNQRALLFSGWGGLHREDLPDSVFMIDSVPHAWLFPHVAAVVHHGGAGTIAAGLRAGKPSIVIPFFGDQPFWGKRVHDLGVGPAPIPRSKLTVDRLAQAIQEAVTNTAMRQRAADLGAKIQAEDGIANAVKIIEGIKS
jgi:UDP:flavonoid glycosyltransferase YjiC (YdhE family)